MSIFGESIETIMSRGGEEKIPTFLKDVLTYLNTKVGHEGLFRISAAVKDIDNMRAQINSGKRINFDGADPHLVAGLLKAYFMDLPEPLFKFDLYDSFIEIPLDQSDSKLKLKALVAKLPEANKLIAGCLFYFLSRVAEHEKTMTTHNLAIVFGQILLRPKVESLESLLRHSPRITQLLKCLMENYSDIIPANREEAQLIQDLITPKAQQQQQSSATPAVVENKPQPVKLSAENQKLFNIKSTVEAQIQATLQQLDVLSQELHQATSLEQTIEIAKRIRTAKRLLFNSGEN